MTFFRLLDNFSNPIKATFAVHVDPCCDIPCLPTEGQPFVLVVGIFLVAAVALVFKNGAATPTPGVGGSSTPAGGSAVPGGDSGDDGDERRRRLLKKILIGLGVVVGATAAACGVGYLVCEGDWTAFFTDPKLFWTSLGATLGVVTTVTTKPEMAAYLGSIWIEVFEHLTTAEVMSPLLGDLEFSESGLSAMMEEVLDISQRGVIRSVIRAYPDGATHHVLQAALEKALTCEIQTIGLKHAVPVN